MKAPAEVTVGAGFAVTVAVSCPQGCDLHSLPLRVTAPGGAVNDLTIGDEALALTAPARAGEHLWTVSFPTHEAAGVHHEESSRTVAISTRPIATSLAVWDVPSPVVRGSRFSIKAGAKSASGCALGGMAIEVRDQAGAVLGTGELKDTPWPGSSALYWTDIELCAPSTDDIASSTVAFAAAGLDLSHDSSSSQFSFAVVPPPEHRLTVTVIEKEKATPIEDVQVIAGVYRAATDRAGMADIQLPKGTYDLAIWKVGFEAEPTTVTVSADLAVEVAATVVPEDDPDAAWQM